MNSPEQKVEVRMGSKAASRSVRPFPESLDDLLRTTPQTTADRLLHIAALGQRIQKYVRFMGAIGNMSGSSNEAKELAIVVFHDCLAALEPQLGDIPERLGCYSSRRKRG